MRRTLIPAFALLGFNALATAALHDTGPMGNSSSGAPTPDAAYSSGMRLPDLATPSASTATAAVQIKRDAARALRDEKLLLSRRLDALSARVEKAEKDGLYTSRQGLERRQQITALRAQVEKAAILRNGRLTRAARKSLESAITAQE